MTDANLRELERRFRATGSVEDEVAWLRARVQAGELSQERLDLAAWCGHPAAPPLGPENAQQLEALQTAWRVDFGTSDDPSDELEVWIEGLGHWHHRFKLGLIALTIFDGPCLSAAAACFQTSKLALSLLAAWLGSETPGPCQRCWELSFDLEPQMEGYHEQKRVYAVLGAIRFACEAAGREGDSTAQVAAHQALSQAELGSGLGPAEFRAYARRALIRIALEDVDFPQLAESWIEALS